MNCKCRASVGLPLRYISFQVRRGRLNGRIGRRHDLSSRQVGAELLASRITCASATSSDSIATLESLPLLPVISIEGEVNPNQEDNVQSSVFAIFDQAKQLQFIGFSKNLRNSLRTVLGRQSGLCYYYRHIDFESVDQQQMMAVRDAWIEENHGPPPGISAENRNLWQQPVMAGGVSERGKQAAAKQQLESILKGLNQRGLREEFIPDENMLAEGKIEFLPAKELTEEEKKAKEEARQRVLEATRTCSVTVDGKVEEFTIFYESMFDANGGSIVDVVVSKDNLATNHRIILGKEYVDAIDLPIREIVERTFSFLFEKKVQRQTEGMLNSNQFPSNYFALSTVDQCFSDFAEAFSSRGLPDEGRLWRFNRIHDYGDKSSALAENAS